MSQLTTEDWIDASAYIAARATWAVGITKTAAVLRNLKNVGTAVTGAAASFADKFIKIFDNVIGASPTVITAEGTVIVNASPVLVAEAAQAIYSLNGMDSDKPAIIKNVDDVLDKQAQQNEEDKKFFEKIKEPLNELTKNNGKIKEIRDMSFKDSHTFSPEHKADGIMNLGKTKEEIISKIIEVIGIADIQNKLKEGDNPIWTCINGYEIEIRVNIKDGLVRFINAFMEYSSRNADKAIRIIYEK